LVTMVSILAKARSVCLGYPLAEANGNELNGDPKFC
jgi:hypothetical protein